MSVFYDGLGNMKRIARGEDPLRALQLYQCCPHGCRYCRGLSGPEGLPSLLFFAPARARAGLLPALEKEASRFMGTDVLLCNMGDPYPGTFQSKRDDITREAITILKGNGCLINLYSKGGTRACRDLDLLDQGDEFAVSLTFLDETLSRQWEPGAATPANRIEALKIAKEAGIPTMVNLAPMIDQEQSLALIDAVAEHADCFQLDRLEYYPRPEGYDYPSFYKKAKALLDDLGKPYSFLGLNEIREAGGGPRRSKFSGVKLPKLF